MKQDRKAWFRGLKGLIRIFVKKTKFVYLGGEPEGPSLILSNHVGALGPLSFELYFPYRMRFWGTYEMNGSLREVYRYQTNVYYHQKKGWNLHQARAFCLLASPLTYLFYRGLRLISTYRDIRFKTTLNESLATLQSGQSIVIFPEDSHDGYHDRLRAFHPGALMLLRYCAKKGVDVPVYVAYFNRHNHCHLLSEPMQYAELCTRFSSEEETLAYLCEKCNELGEMSKEY